MDRSTWRIDIDVTDTGREVTARARLQDAPLATVSVGSARHDEAERDLQPVAALAVERSLSGLGASLDYVSDSVFFDEVDQA